MTFTKEKPWPKVSVWLQLEPATNKYLKHYYKDGYEANNETLLGSLVNLSLQKKASTSSASKYAHLTDRYRCVVGSWVAFRVGTEISLEQNFHINRLILRMMYAELMMYILYHHFISGKSDIQPCIDEFRERYDIYEKEFPDERIRKMYYRIRRTHGSDPSFYMKFLPAKLLMKP
ncbi:hypothetical protein [Runella zeae]|uniref:hypothetical protein n=1 Tax=Runella zeae TaxID=94255 RepID=UPI000401D70A|nr:hypothetical protein [Runella zeae]